MPKLLILGSSNAVPDEKHENTHLALRLDSRVIMVDCAANPIVRLKQAGLDFQALTDLILTHFHPDHVSGVPLLLMDMWLLGRKRPLNIYGLEHTIERMETLMKLYEWESWPNFFPVNFQRLPEAEMTPVLNDEQVRIYASPVCHLIPTIGLRFEIGNHEKVLAYSSDTEPCPTLDQLADGADVLLHEATGPTPGHSSAMQAGETAQKAGAKALYLVHYSQYEYAPQALLREAKHSFSGPVHLGEDFMTISLD
jgi:ribonuclease Z